MTLWRMIFLSEKYGRTRLKLPEIAEQIGIAPSTIRNRRSDGDFQWIKVDGRDLYADVEDVAQYIEQQRLKAVAHASEQRVA